MKKILHVNTVYDKGGAAKIARFLHNRLNQTGGFASHFAYGRGKKNADELAYKFSVPHEIYQNYMISFMTGFSGIGSGISAERLVRYVEKGNFDVIHLHNMHGYYLDNSFIDWLKRSKIKTVWTLHDGWALTGRCAYLSQCGEKWITGCGNCPELSLYPKSIIDTTHKMWLLKKDLLGRGWYPHITVPSKWLFEKTVKSYLYDKKISVIGNSVDTETFRPKDKDESRRSLNIDKNKFVILFIANNLNDKLKGAGYFLECLRKLENKNIVVLTAGKKIKINVRLQCELIQMGYVADRDILPGLYSAADVFCTTSLDEAFGLTVTESLSCGTPVIGFSSGGVKEQVAEHCGMLVEPGDVEGLSKLINAISSNKEMLSGMIQNCRKKVLENYSEDICYKKYRELYENL